MIKHTPGPWFYEGFIKTETRSGWFVSVAPKRTITVEGRTEAEADANARLVAAAPQLLEALKDIHAWVKHWQRDFEANLKPTEGSLADADRNLKAIISKAEGKSQ